MSENSLGRAITYFRKRRDWSTRRLAAKVRDLAARRGIPIKLSNQHLSDVEGGRKGLGSERLALVAAVLGVTADDLLNWRPVDQPAERIDELVPRLQRLVRELEQENEHTLALIEQELDLLRSVRRPEGNHQLAFPQPALARILPGL